MGNRLLQRALATSSSMMTVVKDIHRRVCCINRSTPQEIDELSNQKRVGCPENKNKAFDFAYLVNNSLFYSKCTKM
jgi:hypothetical protein